MDEQTETRMEDVDGILFSNPENRETCEESVACCK
jgi:hypothetical protein